VIVLLVSYMMLSSESSLTDMLPILTFFVMALFRLMPSANRIITSYNQISYYSKSLDLVYDEVNIKQEPKCNRSIVFDRDYVFENISYKYSDGSEVFKEASFSIHKKDRIGIVGASGAGKSTMVEIVMGLLYPKSGSIFVDGIELNEENVLCIRPKIGYVPQDVFLFDGTIADNVFFGRNEDFDKLENVLRQVNMLSYLETLNGCDTNVGDGGALLSGGQRQRIAIARTLYHDPEIIILDEATSGLDDVTAKKLMDEVYGLSDGKTLIIISHNPDILFGCNYVYEVGSGTINKIHSKK